MALDRDEERPVLLSGLWLLSAGQKPRGLRRERQLDQSWDEIHTHTHDPGSELLEGGLLAGVEELWVPASRSVLVLVLVCVQRLAEWSDPSGEWGMGSKKLGRLWMRYQQKDSGRLASSNSLVISLPGRPWCICRYTCSSQQIGFMFAWRIGENPPLDRCAFAAVMGRSSGRPGGSRHGGRQGAAG